MRPRQARTSPRLAVHTDYAYHRLADGVYAERAFALFLARLASKLGHLVVIGRLDPGETHGRYRLGDAVEFAPLPHYPSLASPLRAGWAIVRGAREMWRALNDVDCVWLLGPHPASFVLAGFAALRRRRVVLGVRQDLPAYVGYRHPRRPLLRASASLLDALYRLLARRCATIVVGPALARRYGSSRRLLEIVVSLVEDRDLVDPPGRDYDGELTLLSVGRIEREKNPLLLADVLARLVEREPRWQLAVYGEGPMTSALESRLEELGVADRAELRGYVPLDRGLRDAYREAHVLLHTSWTEGLPQVLFEAFAAGLPVVASDVGGIAGAVGEAVTLYPAGDADAAAAAAQRIAGDPARRATQLRAARSRVGNETLEAVSDRVIAFLAAAVTPAPRAPGQN